MQKIYKTPDESYVVVDLQDVHTFMPAKEYAGFLMVRISPWLQPEKIDHIYIREDLTKFKEDVENAIKEREKPEGNVS